MVHSQISRVGLQRHRNRGTNSIKFEGQCWADIQWLLWWSHERKERMERMGEQ
jgi:hypothetical protein